MLSSDDFKRFNVAGGYQCGGHDNFEKYDAK